MKQQRLKYLAKELVLIAIAFFILDWTTNWIEGRMVYRNWWKGRGTVTLSQIDDPALREKIHNVYFLAKDGVRLNGWYIPAKPGMPTALFAHGNWGNIGLRAGVFREFSERGYGIFGFDYRGYGDSQNVQPTEQGVYKDMTAASHYLAQTLHVPFKNQIAVGESLGSGISVELATHEPLRGLLIFSSYTSIPDVAKEMRHKHELGILDYVPVEMVMRQHFDSVGKISRLHMPVVIAHGEDDAMMPVSMAQRLFSHVQSPCKQFLVIPNADHNTVFYDGNKAIFGALSKQLACGS